MYNLLMDTSTDYLFLAVVDQNLKGEFYLEKHHKKASELIVERLDSLMKKIQISFNEIDSVVVTKGPGSFTGIRLALTVAKMIGYAKAIHVYGVSSLRVYSLLNKASIVTLDARASRFYIGHYDQDVVLEDTIMTLEQLDAYVLAYPHVEVLSIDKNFPSADHLIQSMMKLKQSTFVTKNIHSLLPIYLKNL